MIYHCAAQRPLTASTISGKAGLWRSPSPIPHQRRVTATPDHKFSWTFKQPKIRDARLVRDLPLVQIVRPMEKTRTNNEEKVLALMHSISQIGLQEPIDVLEVDGRFFGFSGCHRFEAHKRLGLPTIKCRVRKANQTVLRMHMM